MAEDNSFVVDSQGNCFLCLTQANKVNCGVTEEIKTERSITSTHSLQYLTHYLKNDWAKVLLNEMGLVGEEFISQETLMDLDGFKVSLCQDCVHLNERFAEVYQQLQKIAMEMSSCLSLINGKLRGAEESGATRRFRTNMNVNGGDSDEPVMGGVSVSSSSKLVIVEALREDVMQKCSSSRLLTIPPPDDLHNPTPIVANFGAEEELPTTSSHHNSAPEMDVTSVKLEKPEDPLLMEETGNSYLDLDYQPHSSSAAVLDDSSSLEMEMEGEEEEDDDNSALELGPPPPPPDSFKKVSSTPTLQFRRDRKTGKFPCPACPSQFKSNKGIRYHYECVHLQVRYECVLCGNEFNSLSTHNTHYQTVHMGVCLHKCDLCGKNYSSKSNVNAHRRTCSGVPRKEAPQTCRCVTCGKGFATRLHLRRHFNHVHLKSQGYECKRCGKSFTRKDNLDRHRQRKHANDVHLGPGGYECGRCGQSFTRKDNLDRHKLRKHSKKGKK